VAELNLITENARGQQRKYSVKVYLKSDDAGDRQFLEYLSPADVRGTKFLSLNLEARKIRCGCTYLQSAGNGASPPT